MAFPPRREDLVDLTGYHSPQIEVPVRLNTNESPYEPPGAFRDALAAAVGELAFHRYPDRGAAELRGALGAFLGQPAERVFCANGSNEVLQTLLLAYGGAGRTAAVFEPSYLLHRHIARITGTAVAVGGRRADFTVDPGEARRLLAETSPEITFLCSPNNPTGVVEPIDVLDEVLDAAPGLVVVDEAYGEFAPSSAIERVADDLPLVVVRTFSKVWSLAALRLGFCVAPPRVVADLDLIVLPYHLSSITQAAGRLALDWRDEMRGRVEAIVAERERVAGALAALEGVTVFPSGANFLLFRPPGEGASVWDALVREGVIVRDFSAREGLEGCLRVTIGTPEENTAFLTAMERVVGALRPGG